MRRYGKRSGRQIPIIPANRFPKVVLYLQAAASGSDSATTLEERAPCRVQIGEEIEGYQEHMVTEGPKARSPKHCLFICMLYCDGLSCSWVA